MTLRSFIWQYIHQTIDAFTWKNANGGLIEAIGVSVTEGRLTGKQATEYLRYAKDCKRDGVKAADWHTYFADQYSGP